MSKYQMIINTIINSSNISSEISIILCFECTIYVEVYNCFVVTADTYNTVLDVIALKMC